MTGGVHMAKAGRPKKEDPISHVVTVKFNNRDYELMVEYAKNHDMSISQLLRYGVKMQLKKDENI